MSPNSYFHFVTLRFSPTFFHHQNFPTAAPTHNQLCPAHPRAGGPCFGQAIHPKFFRRVKELCLSPLQKRRNSVNVAKRVGKYGDTSGRGVMENGISDVSEDSLAFFTLEVWNQNDYELLRNQHCKKEKPQNVV